MCTYKKENGKAPYCTRDCAGCIWQEESEKISDLEKFEEIIRKSSFTDNNSSEKDAELIKNPDGHFSIRLYDGEMIMDVEFDEDGNIL